MAQSESEKVLTVTQINTILREMIDGTFSHIILEGEISNWRPASSGHVYFTLKDKNSQISAVMWRSDAARIPFAVRDGMLVRCYGRVTVYIQRGNYQVVVARMVMAGSGDILQMIEERKQRLAAEGLFAEERKKTLPFFPHTVGVITSPSGAALRDILQITRRRNSCVSVIVFPAVVQGDGAANTIVRQIKTANAFKMCDVLIVGRGGGSLEDLLPFSEESVVRAVAESEIPIVSAVGHEIDWALSDFAADFRAPTPSAAAEIVVPLEADILQTVKYYADELYKNICQRTQHCRLTVRTFDAENLELMFRRIEQPLTQRFDNAKESLIRNMQMKLKDTRAKVRHCVEILESASPESIFARGYAMVTDKTTGKIVRNAADVAIGTEIEITPAKGKLNAMVTARATS